MSSEIALAVWGVLALVSLIVEVLHRTFYLLFVSFAFGAGMLAVWMFHAGLETQLVVIAAVGIIGIPIAGKWRQHSRGPHLAMDQGQLVKVVTVRDGKLRVLYRGAEWDAVFPGPPPSPGENLRIQEMDGNTLKLTSL